MLSQWTNSTLMLFFPMSSGYRTFKWRCRTFMIFSLTLIMSGLLSDMLTASLAKHSRVLTENKYFNGHPDLVVQGVYAGNSVKSGTEGVEIKTTRKVGGAVDTHGARAQWMGVFVYDVDCESEPASERCPMAFREIYLGQVTVDDFRKNPRGELGTRTATLHKAGIQKLRLNWVYRL
jgi:hypothetical protein